MFKFPSLVISDQFLIGHISQILVILEFFACFSMEMSGSLHWIFQWIHLKVKKNEQLCVIYMYPTKMSLKIGSPEYPYQSRQRSCCKTDVWHNIHFFLFRFEKWERLYGSLNIHIFAFPISFSVNFDPLCHMSAQSGKSAAIIATWHIDYIFISWRVQGGSPANRGLAPLARFWCA